MPRGFESLPLRYVGAKSGKKGHKRDRTGLSLLSLERYILIEEVPKRKKHDTVELSRKEHMVKRVKKGEWGAFLAAISERYRFCPITVEEISQSGAHGTEGLYFIGARVCQKIDKTYLEVYVSKPQDPRAGYLFMSVGSPQSLSFDETEQDGVRLISITQDQQQKFRIRFTGPPSSQARMEAIAKVAYFLYERRGGMGGSDLQDWGDAERLFSDWERLIDLKFI